MKMERLSKKSDQTSIDEISILNSGARFDKTS
jgi:hypothetical protein